jgi:hypothetical protein
MSDLGPVFRGFRPSRVSPYSREDNFGEVLRLANLERYIRRAQAGLPIFDDTNQGGASGDSWPRKEPGR